LTVPGPVPEPGSSVSQAAPPSTAAVHAYPAGQVTLIAPLPPPFGTAAEVGWMLQAGAAVMKV